MSTPALRLLPTGDAQPCADGDAGWLEWLVAHVDPDWRLGEWDAALWLFTGDLDSDRTAAWQCRTPGCPTTTRRHNGRCSGCRRARTAAGISEEEFDRRPRRRPTRPIAPGTCSVAGCQGERHSSGLCFRHERAWRRAGKQVEEFIGHVPVVVGFQ
jgi:hypothetical protein